MGKDKILRLEDIVQYEIPPIFRRQHLNRDSIIGLIGDRGGGKSVGAGAVGLFDYMLQGEPCWANMQVRADFEISNETAGQYGLRGGIAHFESTPLDVERFLNFDPEYRGGCVIIDEYNIAVADARRAMSNQNLASDDIGQMLRKLKDALIYTCIQEMFVDVRVRDLTDVFVQTSDTALTPEGLARCKPQGEQFMWFVYPMTKKLTGEKFADTHKALGPYYLEGKYVLGLIDTHQMQERQKFAIKTNKMEAEIEITEDTKITASKNRFPWLPEKIIQLREKLSETKRYSSTQLDKLLGVSSHGQRMSEMGKVLPMYGITRTNKHIPPSKGGGYYWEVEPGAALGDFDEMPKIPMMMTA